MTGQVEASILQDKDSLVIFKLAPSHETIEVISTHEGISRDNEAERAVKVEEDRRNKLPARQLSRQVTLRCTEQFRATL